MQQYHSGRYQFQRAKHDVAGQSNRIIGLIFCAGGILLTQRRFGKGSRLASFSSSSECLSDAKATSLLRKCSLMLLCLGQIIVYCCRSLFVANCRWRQCL